MNSTFSDNLLMKIEDVFIIKFELVTWQVLTELSVL